ncbi:hypothetical protein QV03_09515 [Gallibacterium anatis]|uniref:Uncharacterized protein n=1 Tax=Gallibacterium anatis TaxID=750 RepID=A0A1A7P8N8_9PAST|nr:hypothetical protein QV03_09515 [Gallibacterium anatis]
MINKDGVTADNVTAGTTTTNSLVVKDKPAEGATDAKEVDISSGQITFKDNTDSTDGTFKSLVLSTTQSGTNALGASTDTKTDRLVFAGKQLATTDDGLSFKGDLLQGETTATIINRKLNSLLKVEGGYSGSKDDLTSGNIAVVATPDDTLKLRLAKNLQSMNSIAFGDVGSNSNPYIKMTLNGASSATASATSTSPIMQFESKNGLAAPRISGIFTEGLGEDNTFKIKGDSDVVTVGELKAYTQGRANATDTSIQNLWYGFSTATTTTTTPSDGSTATTTTTTNYAVRHPVTSTDGAQNVIPVKGDKNISVKATGTSNKDENGELQISLTKDVSIGTHGTGNGGTLTVNGEENSEQIVLNGSDSTISITDGKQQRLLLDGTKGEMTFLNAAGNYSVFTLTPQAIPTLDGSKPLYRIQMDGVAVATLDDGMKFAGNSMDQPDIITRTLNDEVLQVKGGFALSDGAKVEDKTTDKNTYVVAEKDAEGKLTGSLLVRLAKDLTDLNSASFKNSDGSSTTVNTTVDGNGISITPNNTEGKPDISLTKDGLSNGGNKITNLADGTISSTSDDAVTGKQLYNLAQQYQGDNAKDSEDKDIIVKRKSSDILRITGGASDVSSNNNIGVTANATEGTLTLRLAKSLDLGPDGKLTIGNASLANDSIKVGDSTLNKNGLTATNVTATTVTGGTLRVGDETNGVAVLKASDRKGDPSPVLQFGDSTNLSTYLTNVAAGKNDTDAVNYKQLKELKTSLTTKMDGGLTFEGNTSETWKRNLGDTVTIKGGFEPQNGETYTDKTTDQNTYVALETDDASKKSLVVRLAKELRDLTSAEFKTVVKNDDGTEKTTVITKVDGSGITITPNKENGTPDTSKEVSLTQSGLNNGGNKITNVADGEIKAGSTDAINGGQLYQYQQATNTAVDRARTQVTGTGAAIVTKTTTDGRDSYNVHVEETMAFTNADGDKLIKGADGKWYKPTDIAGKVYDATSKTWKQVGDDGSLQDLAQQPSAEMIKGADGKWYKPDDIKGLVYNDGAWKKVGEDGSMQEVTPPTATSPSLRLVDADGGTNNTIKLENLASAIGGKVVDEAMNGNNSFIKNLRTVGEPNGITPNAAVTTQDLRNLADTGFKLQTSGGMTANQAATTVKLGDTVQVLDGKNTRVSTITSNNGVHSYAINVDGLPMSFTDDQGNALVKVGDNFYKASDIGAGDTLVKVGDKLYKASDLDNQGQPKSGATEITASTPAGVSLVDKDGKSTAQKLSGIQSSVADVEVKGTDGQVNQNASFTDKLAQAATDDKRKDNAVNVSDLNEVAKAAKDAQATADKGFNVKVSASGTGVASATDDLKENGQNIKPGDTFTFEAGDNITLTQAQGKLTIATNNQGIVNNAQLPVAYTTTTDKDGKRQKVYKGEDGQFYTVAGVNKDGNIVGKDGSVTSAKDKVVPTGNIITSVQNADGSVTNPSKLTNVADGAVVKGSKDAINGGQLYEYLGINKDGDDIQITQVTVNKPDGTTTVINVPTDKAGNPYLTTYNVKEQGEHITNNVYTAIRNMNEQGIKYFHVNAGQDIPEKQASNSEDSNASAKYAAAIGYQANVESGAEGGLAIGKGATITKDSVGSIAIGSGGKVSGKNSISIGSGNIVKGDGSGAFGDPSSVTGDGSYALGNNNTIEANNAFAVGNETKVTADNAVAVGHKTKVTTKNSVALGANAQATQTIEELQSAVPVGDPERVRGYGKQVIGEVSVGGVNEAGEQEVRRITNVAAGSAPTDAVNVSQLEASKYETNKKINHLARDIDKLDKRIDGVAASAAAMANLPQPTAPGKSMVSLGVGSHRSQQAIAIGVSRISDNGKIVIKASATQNTNGNATVGAGVGFQW